jgi:hypothetical protein
MKDLPQGSGIEWLIVAGVSSEEIAAMNEKEKHAKEITDCYEIAMGYNPLNWAKMDRLKRFLLTKTTDEIKTFAAWIRKEYSTFTPAKARQYPDMVIDLWPQAFIPQAKKGDRSDFLAALERA